MYLLGRQYRINLAGVLVVLVFRSRSDHMGMEGMKVEYREGNLEIWAIEEGCINLL